MIFGNQKGKTLTRKMLLKLGVSDDVLLVTYDVSPYEYYISKDKSTVTAYSHEQEDPVKTWDTDELITYLNSLDIITASNGLKYILDDFVPYMDEEILNKIQSELRPCSDQSIWDRYCQLDKNAKKILKKLD